MTTVTEPAADEIIAFLGGAIAIRIPGERTGGAYAALEQVLPGRMATPLHVHDGEDETFHVLEGEITVLRGEETLTAGAGDVVRLPRGVPHAFRVDSDLARIVDVVTPAGHERFFRLAGEPRAALAPTPMSGPPDMGRMMAAAERVGLRILGPPPFGEE